MSRQFYKCLSHAATIQDLSNSATCAMQRASRPDVVDL